MKYKITSLVALSAGLLASAQAQEMVAGWDFSQYANAGGFSTIDGSTLTGQANANFSQGNADFNGAAALGTVYYDGSFGSTAFDLNAPEVEVGGDLGTLGGDGTIGASGQRGVLTGQGQQFGNAHALGLNTNGSITFAIDLSTFPLFTAGSDWSLVFATQFVEGPGGVATSATAAWDYSLDGVDFVSTGETSEFELSAAVRTVDLSDISALDGQSQVFFRATYSGIDSGIAFLDNFQVNAVPEPSAFAAIFGVVALGLAAVRRHRRA